MHEKENKGLLKRILLVCTAIFSLTACDIRQLAQYQIRPVDPTIQANLQVHSDIMRGMVSRVALQAHLLDMTNESLTPHTICYFAEQNKLGLFIGARVEPDFLLIDVGRHGIGGYNPTIPKMEENLIAEIEKHYPHQYRRVESWEKAYIR